MKELNYSFEYLEQDCVRTKVKVYKDKTIEVENFSKDPIECAFGRNERPAISDLEKFFEERCFPKSRYNLKEVLRAGNLDFYDPYSIVRKTHGAFTDETFWIRFDDEPNLVWQDVNPRENINRISKLLKEKSI